MKIANCKLSSNTFNRACGCLKERTRASTCLDGITIENTRSGVAILNFQFSIFNFKFCPSCILLALFACAGCMVGPDYHRPEVKVPPTWHDGAEITEAPSEAAPPE